MGGVIISYQTTTGNYNAFDDAINKIKNYIIPNNNWELQRNSADKTAAFNYIIPNNNWELQLNVE